MLTIIIPTGSDLQALKRTLASLGKTSGKEHELLLVTRAVDQPELVALAERHGARLIEEPGPRGAQKNTGMAAASGWALILHPGAKLAAGWQEALRGFTGAPGSDARAAMFRFALEDERPEARRYEKVMEFCYRFGGGSGAQGLILHRSLWESLGEFRPEPLYDDFAMLQAVHRQGKGSLVTLPVAALLESKHYQQKGSYWKGLLRRLTSLYFYGIGMPPRKIAESWPPG